MAELSQELSLHHQADAVILGIDMNAELGLIASEEDEHVGPLHTSHFVDDNHIYRSGLAGELLREHNLHAINTFLASENGEVSTGIAFVVLSLVHLTMRRTGGQIDQDEPFTDGPNHGGWLQHMMAGHSRVKASAELAASVKTDNFPLDIEEVARLLKEAPAPPSGEYILDLLRPEEAVFLAVSVHFGAGKARKLKRSITLGNMELDLSTLSKRQICS
eukprot:4786661-Amphidinium_carterae.1